MESVANHIHLLRPPIIKLWHFRRLIKASSCSIASRQALVQRFLSAYRLEENKPDFDGRLKPGDIGFLIMAPHPTKIGYALVLGACVFTRIAKSRQWRLKWHWLHPFSRKRGLLALAIEKLESQGRRLVA